MDLEIYFLVLVVLCLEGGETGGHGEKHHDHVKLHVPEFIHHDHHTKVITIHHHHHKPKKEHHHHHHHHHKPHIPHGHHYHHHQNKAHITTHTVSKGHKSHHGHQGHHGHHGHQGHHGHHGHKSHHGHEHHGHSHGHHNHDTPSISYDPNPISTFEDDFGSSFTPSVPTYGGGIAPQIPHVHGITHTVKQVKVFDSLPGVIPGNTGGRHGYEVTEQAEEGDDDVFTSVNSLHQSYPATYGYLRGAAPHPASHDPFAEEIPQGAIQTNHHDPFAEVPQPTSALSGEEIFTRTAQSEPFGSSAPTQNAGLPSIQPSPEFPVSFQSSGLDDPTNSFVGTDIENTALISADGDSTGNDTPVSFSREAGIQQSTKTGAVETIVY